MNKQNNNKNNGFGSEVFEYNESIMVGKKRNSQYKMNYTVFGNGNEKVLFLMGYMLGGKYWKSTIRNYLNQPDTYTVCIFDQCGTGNSEFKFFTSYRELASDVDELLDHLKWEKTNVIGLSAGTLVGNELSKIVPNKMKTLTLMSMPQFCGGSKFSLRGINHFLFIKWNSMLYNVKPETMFNYLYLSDKYYQSPSKFKKGNNGQHVIPLLKTLYHDIYNAKIILSICHFLSVIKYKIRHQYLTKDEVLSRPFPLLMFYGGYDPLIDFKKKYFQFELLQPNLIYFCKGAGHCLNFEEIDLVYEKTTKFINENQNYNKKNNKKQFLKVESLDFNLNGNNGKNYNEIYKPTKFYKLPLFENLKTQSKLKLSNLFDLNKKRQLLSFALTLIKK